MVWSLGRFHILALLPEAGVRRGSPPRAGSVPRIILVGTSYKTADISFRENFAERVRNVQDVASAGGVREYSVLETCNRVELYTAVAGEGTVEAVVRALGYQSAEGFYIREGLDAISHLFGVATGLDSVALGEGQILRQVRAAGIQGRASGSAKSVLAPLFDAAYTSAVRVRRKYAMATEGGSLSDVALGLALERLGGDPSNVLVAGTGETAKLAARRLNGAKIHLLTARRGGSKHFPNSVRVPRRSLRSVIAKCELVICATRRPGYVLSVGDVPDRGRRVVLDLGFPRNVDPGVKALSSVELLNLDDVASMAGRSEGAAKLATVRRAVDAEAFRFNAWLTATRLNPALASIYRWAEVVRSNETSSALRRLPRLSERERKVVEAMSRRIVSRLMAPHAEFVKGDSTPEGQQKKLRLLEEIFPSEVAS